MGTNPTYSPCLGTRLRNVSSTSEEEEDNQGTVRARKTRKRDNKGKNRGKNPVTEESSEEENIPARRAKNRNNNKG